MQKIFSQEIRFKDDNGNNYPDWEGEKLRKMLLKKGKGQNLGKNIVSDYKNKYFIWCIIL